MNKTQRLTILFTQFLRLVYLNIIQYPPPLQPPTVLIYIYIFFVAYNNILKEIFASLTINILPQFLQLIFKSTWLLLILL